ncbi:hypothetical protein D8674_010718 [Pyrus ussuriensis x Pyrus communis]|uniref:RRM domain-containing protein n=1 Tax=Pyrus ussuriensis x Pyrus communis TaxID=2448454 RepID=A0A5N5FBU9_9ROSA|nr:hypothetical protein D8674_010718 [Pyrus ussuriensis x Pyrus communis]
MANRNLALAKPIWMKQAKEARRKSEAMKATVAKASFEATFNDMDKIREMEPIGLVDPVKCTAAGAGIAGGIACATSSFMVGTEDSDERKVPNGGVPIDVKVVPRVGAGGSEQEGMARDMGDGTYIVTYVVPKRGNYMLSVECSGKPIMGSPFPVFFSADLLCCRAGSSAGGPLRLAPPSTFPNLVNQTMPNMPNYSGFVSGAFPGMLGMIPGIVPGASGGAILPGIGASLGEICREYLSGRCAQIDCKLNQSPHNLLILQQPLRAMLAKCLPSTTAMATAQAIVAAQALQAHAAQVQAHAQSNKDSSGSLDKAGKPNVLEKALQVSNLSPLLTVEQLNELFSYCGTVVECIITNSKHFAYIEYSKAEEAIAALQLNNMDVGGRLMNVEMAKLVPQQPAAMNSSMASSSLPMVMQKQALLMQQTMTAQQGANRATTMKTATELAAARAAEISKKLNADEVEIEEKQTKEKSRSPSPSCARSKSRSRSPINYRRRQRSPSNSPPSRYPREHRSRSPLRSRHYSNIRNGGDRTRRRDSDRSHDHHLSTSRRTKSMSISPRTRKTHRVDLVSPKHRRESSPHRTRAAPEGKHHLSDKKDDTHYEKEQHGEKSSLLTILQSSSVSTKGKRHKRRLSPRSSNEKKSRQRERSRDKRSKHRGIRPSRSKSVEPKHDTRRGSSPRSLDDKKRKHRRRSRSKLQCSNDRAHKNRDEKEKSHRRRPSRSTLVEPKRGRRSKLSPRSTDEKESKHSRRRSRPESSEGKHQASLEKPSSVVKDSTKKIVDGVVISAEDDFDSKESMRNVGTEDSLHMKKHGFVQDLGSKGSASRTSKVSLNVEESIEEVSITENLELGTSGLENQYGYEKLTNADYVCLGLWNRLCLTIIRESWKQRLPCKLVTSFLVVFTKRRKMEFGRNLNQIGTLLF